MQHTIKHIKRSLCLVIGLGLWACDSKEEHASQKAQNQKLQADTDVVITDERVKLKFLNRYNSIDLVVEGTAKFDSIKKHYSELPLKFINRSRWVDTRYKRFQKQDSVHFSWAHDSIRISHCFFSSGTCLWMHPYCNTIGDTVHVYNPEVIEGAIVSVFKGDTTSAFPDCGLATIAEHIIKIPHMASQKGKIMKYHNHKGEDRVYKIK